MKNTIISIAIILIMVVSLGAILVISSNTTRSNELEQNINTAAKQTMDYYTNEEGVNDDSFVAMFTENLIALSDSDSSLQVNVLHIELDKGVFSVNVKETYINNIGMKRTIECEDTLIVDFGGTVSKTSSVDTNVVISFMWLDQSTPIYEFQTHKNSSFKTPDKYGIKLVTPENLEFVGWTNDPNTINAVNMSEEIATTDKTYYAVFKNTLDGSFVIPSLP